MTLQISTKNNPSHTWYFYFIIAYVTLDIAESYHNYLKTNKRIKTLATPWRYRGQERSLGSPRDDWIHEYQENVRGLSPF